MKDILFTLHGFDFKADTLYQVTEKTDSSASEGFKEFKTTKILHPDVSNAEPGAIFDGVLGIWDTGLYSNSRALIEAMPSEAEREKLVKELTKLIVTPIEKLRGKNLLSPSKDNNDFWDNYRIDIRKGTLFNTKNNEDLYKLYLAVLHMYVTPKPIESHPAFKNSQYCIVDKEDVVDRKMEHEMELVEATGVFYNLLKKNRKDLDIILDYLRLGVSENTEDRVLISLFNNWLKDKTDGYQNAKIFTKTCDNFLTKDGEKEMFYYSKMKGLIKSGVVKQKKNEIWFEEEFVGADLRSAVKSIRANPELEKRLLIHIE